MRDLADTGSDLEKHDRKVLDSIYETATWYGLFTFLGFFESEMYVVNAPKISAYARTYGWWTKSCTTKDDDYPIV